MMASASFMMRADELGAGRDVVDQSLRLSGRPDARIHLALVEHVRAAHAGDEILHVGEGGVAALLDGDDFVADGVLRHARGVVQRAEDEIGAALVIGDDLLFYVLMDRRFLRRHEARAHVDAVATQRQRRHQTARVGDAARGDDRNGQLVGGAREQHEAADIVFAGMAGTFETVDRHAVDADRLRFHRVAHAGAFVDDLDAGFLEARQMRLRIVAGRLHDLDAASMMASRYSS